MTRIELVTPSLPRKYSTPELHRQLFFLTRAEDEIRTRDPQLGRLMLYQLSYFRNFWWGEQDSNLRRHKSADLQSAPVGRFGISPIYNEPPNLQLVCLTRTIANFGGQMYK